MELHLRLVRESFSADIGETIRLIDGMIAPPAVRFDRPDLRSVDLFTDRWVLLMDAANPAVHQELTPARLAVMPWVVPFAPERGFSAAAPITRQFTRLGVEPDTRVRVESYLAVPHLVAGTDRVALVQERLARDVAAGLGLVSASAPAPTARTAPARSASGSGGTPTSTTTPRTAGCGPCSWSCRRSCEPLTCKYQRG